MLEGLAVGGKSLGGLPERFVGGGEIDIGDSVIRGLRDGLAVSNEGLTVVLLLVIGQAKVVVGMGVRGCESDGTTIGRFRLGMGSQGSIGQAEEQMGDIRAGLYCNGLLQGNDCGLGFVVTEIAQTEVIIAGGTVRIDLYCLVWPQGQHH